ncbi:MAG: ABC transporter substrate-binding protein [Clostridia bacterium]
MNKKLFVILSVLLSFALVLASCGNRNENNNTGTPGASNTPQPTASGKPFQGDRIGMTAKVVGLKGPTAMGMVRLFTEIDSLSDLVSLEFDIVSSPDVITAGLINGDITVAAVPTNVAAMLYNKLEGNIRMLAVNTFGVIHIVADKSLNIETMDDLRGKTITATGKGTVPEYVLNYILEKNGMVPGTDVTIEYRSDHSELATLVAQGEIEIAMLPEPFVSIATGINENIELAIDLTDEWKKVSPEGSELTMGCLISTAEFAETYPQEVVELLAFYNTSVNWVNSEPEKAAELIVLFNILPDTETAVRAIPGSNIRFVFSQNSKEMLNAFYKVLYDYDPRSIGGSIPGDDFYFTP